MRFFAILLLFTLGSAAQDAAESKAIRVQKLYDKAFQHYTQGEYDEALKSWDDVLRLDSEQKTARQMIKDVTEEIRRKNATKLKAVYAHIAAGQYSAALSRLETVVGEDSRVSISPALQSQLTELSAFLPSIPGKTKAWKMTATGINAAIGIRQDAKLAYNALRYAVELNPAEDRIKKALDWYLTFNSDQSSSDSVTPGMSLLEYKRRVALEHFYDSKHHLSIGVLNEILALEPNDIVSLKRLGSAYYSLNLHDNARQAWQRVLKLSPDDKQLKSFLKKLPPKHR